MEVAAFHPETYYL